MPFRFRRSDGTVEAGVRRIACEQIDRALEAIRAADEDRAEQAVHEVRRRIKAVRALLRLVRPAFAGFDLENAAFRDMGRMLAPARDGKILTDTLDALAGQSDVPLDAQRIASLRKRLGGAAAQSRPLHRVLAQCEEALIAARVRAAGWSLQADGWDALDVGFARTVRAARRAMRDLAESGDPHCSHEWRKQVKYHWHHMRLLRGVADRPAETRIERATRLADLLGDRHDLDLFVETLPGKATRADAAIIDRLVLMANRRARHLGHDARACGTALFDEKPRKLAARWRERWEDWARELA